MMGMAESKLESQPLWETEIDKFETRKKILVDFLHILVDFQHVLLKFSAIVTNFSPYIYHPNETFT